MPIISSGTSTRHNVCFTTLSSFNLRALHALFDRRFLLLPVHRRLVCVIRWRSTLADRQFRSDGPSWFDGDLTTTLTFSGSSSWRRRNDRRRVIFPLTKAMSEHSRCVTRLLLLLLLLFLLVLLVELLPRRRRTTVPV